MIQEFTSGMDFEAFRSTPMAVAAVERKQSRGGRFGIWEMLRHEYDKVDLAIIWQTATDDLPAVKFAVQRALIAHIDLKGRSSG